MTRSLSSIRWIWVFPLVPDDLAFDEIPDVLGNPGGVVGNPFAVAATALGSLLLLVPAHRLFQRLSVRFADQL